MHCLFYLILLIISYAARVTAQPDTDLTKQYMEGNQLYAAGKYEDALSKYLGLKEQNLRSGELYYNIGNAYYKLNQLGEAILYYERALKYLPQDEDLLTNLQLARLSIPDKITPLPELFYERYWRSFTYLLTFSAWKTIAYALYLLLGIWLALRIIFRSRIVRTLSKTVIFILFIGAFLCFWISISMSRDRESADTGIILAADVNIRSSPADEGTALFSLHEGTKVWIKRRSEGWSEIRIADGKTGWLPQESYEVI